MITVSELRIVGNVFNAHAGESVEEQVGMADFQRLHLLDRYRSGSPCRMQSMNSDHPMQLQHPSGILEQKFKDFIEVGHACAPETGAISFNLN